MRRILLVLMMIILPIILIGCEDQESLDNVNIDGYYNANLVCQNVALSSWVTNINVEIKDDVLFFDDTEIGKVKRKMLTLNIDQDTFSIEKEHQSFFDNLINIKEGFVVGNISNDIDMSMIIVNYIDNYYLLIASYTVGVGYEIIKGYYLGDEVVLTFTDYPGGCIVMEHFEKVKIGSVYDLDRPSEIIGINCFIDLKTLTIYEDSIVVTKNLDLVSYNNGVYDVYIYNYIFNNNDYEFKGWFTSFDKIKTYEYKVLENKDIEIVYDDITYILRESKQLGENNYYVANISTSKKLFGLDYPKAKEVLDLLYGSENYEMYLITIDLDANGYNIKLEERTING